MSDKPIAAGKSSYDLIDAGRFWQLLALAKNAVLLDLGCGMGNYTMGAATQIGPEGMIYAIDAWYDGIVSLKDRLADLPLTKIQPIVADINQPLPLDPQSVDVCLMATVVHDLIQVGQLDGTMAGVQKVLAPGGRLAVVEFKKIDGPPGPPIHIRLSAKELEKALKPYGFDPTRVDDIGSHHYLAQFTQ